MGRKGRRPGAIDTAPTFPEPKQPHDNSRHRELCRLAGKWLRKPKFGSSYCPYVAVELVTASQEIPDVFGWNYWATVLIEVKVSRSDFLADAKKSFRQQPEEGVGAFRYYCSPEGLITEVDLPDKWGLLWEKDGVITVVKDAERQQQNAQGEITILASIMRREGVKPRLFDYESKIMSMKQNEETKALQEEIRTLKAEKKELACRLSGLSSTLIQVLKVKSLRGCEVKNWVGFQNGNGTDVGQDIERLIKRAEREQKYLLTVKHE